ncbi:MAG TPA: hypothetical protein PK011_06215, partial [Marinagarivorans sp.]|nr:hypothetical protein [Marinagarivorans sp.]
MGAKTCMLIYQDEGAKGALAEYPPLDRAATDRLVQALFPAANPIGTGSLANTHPPKHSLYAGCFGGLSIVAAREFGDDRPSRLPQRFIDYGKNQHIYLHAMHSVVDWFAFGHWQGGVLVRALSLSPDRGLIEDLGSKEPFEQGFWHGERPATAGADEDYPLAFHPLDLAEEALQAILGFQLEGPLNPDALQPERIPLVVYSRAKPW